MTWVFYTSSVSIIKCTFKFSDRILLEEGSEVKEGSKVGGETTVLTEDFLVDLYCRTFELLDGRPLRDYTVNFGSRWDEKVGSENVERR